MSWRSRAGHSLGAWSCCDDLCASRSSSIKRRPASNNSDLSNSRVRGAGQSQAEEYAVLVTSLPCDVLALGQLYRDRADAENSFDELKNQWGWGGFTTHDLHRCQLSARAVALIYNWWSLFVRLANPDARREGDHQPPLAHVLNRSAYRARRPDDDQPDRPACRIQQGPAGAHTSLGAASGMVGRGYPEQLDPRSVWQRCCAHLKHTLAAIEPVETLRLLL